MRRAERRLAEVTDPLGRTTRYVRDEAELLGLAPPDHEIAAGSGSHAAQTAATPWMPAYMSAIGMRNSGGGSPGIVARSGAEGGAAAAR